MPPSRIDFNNPFDYMDHKNNPTEPTKDGVVVYCASSQRVDPKYLNAAHQTGALIAQAGLRLLCGGGAMGLMAAAIEGCVEANGCAIGVLPHFMIEKGWGHPHLTQCIDTPSMHVRKQTMANLSCAAIALPGGIGTLDELAEIMTWHQLELFTGPVIIVNIDGFYNPLIEMFKKMTAEKFMRDDIIPAHIVSTPAEAIQLIKESR